MNIGIVLSFLHFDFGQNIDTTMMIVPEKFYQIPGSKRSVSMVFLKKQLSVSQCEAGGGVLEMCISTACASSGHMKWMGVIS